MRYALWASTRDQLAKHFDYPDMQGLRIRMEIGDSVRFSTIPTQPYYYVRQDLSTITK